MTARLTDHDWELLSTYLDSSLSPADARDVEERLLSDPVLKAALVSLRQTRGILRSVPRVKRRRNFYLTTEMAGQKQWTWLIPMINLSSAATGLLAVLLLMLNFWSPGTRSAPSQPAMMFSPVLQATAAPATVMTDALSPAPTITLFNSAPAAQPETMKEAEQPKEPEMAPRLSLDEPSQAVAGMESEPAPPAATPLMAKGEEPSATSVSETSSETVTAQKAELEDQALATPSLTRILPGESSQETLATPTASVALSVGPTETILPAILPVPGGAPGDIKKAPVESYSEGYRWKSSPMLPGVVLLLISVLLAAVGYVLRKRLH
ncbi:hypothetical protein hrd7_06060 [Leptolinea sp. HRD-7]|nr:hypothetical protein hrd7_06060 [Leptolinea sp. HRD-7]